MAVDHDLLERRYLLGDTSEDERIALEQAFFRDPDAFERVETAEDVLIEQYLSRELDAAERRRFEREYLRSPDHRYRVDVVRALQEMASKSPQPAPQPQPLWLIQVLRRRPMIWWAAAAAAAVMAAGAVWIVLARGPQSRTPQSTIATRPPAGQPGTGGAAGPVTPPRVIAFSLSPISVRGDGDAGSLVIPPNTDRVELTLQQDVEVPAASLAEARVIIQTANGDEVWRGPAIIGTGRPVTARVEVPAARLQRPDDYVIALTTSGHELARYVLHVRSR